VNGSGQQAQLEAVAGLQHSNKQALTACSIKKIRQSGILDGSGQQAQLEAVAGLQHSSKQAFTACLVKNVRQVAFWMGVRSRPSLKRWLGCSSTHSHNQALTVLFSTWKHLCDRSMQQP
jgi:hypothetical protein